MSTTRIRKITSAAEAARLAGVTAPTITHWVASPRTSTQRCWPAVILA